MFSCQEHSPKYYKASFASTDTISVLKSLKLCCNLRLLKVKALESPKGCDLYLKLNNCSPAALESELCKSSPDYIKSSLCHSNTSYGYTIYTTKPTDMLDESLFHGIVIDDAKLPMIIESKVSLETHGIINERILSDLFSDWLRGIESIKVIGKEMIMTVDHRFAIDIIILTEYDKVQEMYIIELKAVSPNIDSALKCIAKRDYLNKTFSYLSYYFPSLIKDVKNFAGIGINVWKTNKVNCVVDKTDYLTSEEIASASAKYTEMIQNSNAKPASKRKILSRKKSLLNNINK